MDALFTAVDVSTLSSNTSTLLIAFVGVNLLFLGYKYIKKSMGRA